MTQSMNNYIKKDKLDEQFFGENYENNHVITVLLFDESFCAILCSILSPTFFKIA